MKKFKEYEQDPKIVTMARSLHWSMLNECQQNLITISRIAGWPHKLSVYPQHIVQYAVYESQWSREWQIFRIALKGLTTRQKLFQLLARWGEAENAIKQGRIEEYRAKIVQIENYIGALKRGGQLNNGLEVTDVQ